MEFTLATGLEKQSFQYFKRALDLDHTGIAFASGGQDTVEIPVGYNLGDTSFPGLSVLKCHEGGEIKATTGQHGHAGRPGGFHGGTNAPSRARLLFNLSAAGSLANTGNPFGKHISPHGPGKDANEFRVLTTGIAANDHNLTDCFITSAYVGDGFGAGDGKLYELAIANGYHDSQLALVDHNKFATIFTVSSAHSMSPGMKGQTTNNPSGKAFTGAAGTFFSLTAIQGFATNSQKGLSGKGIALGTAHRRQYYLGNI